MSGSQSPSPNVEAALRLALKRLDPTSEYLAHERLTGGVSADVYSVTAKSCTAEELRVVVRVLSSEPGSGHPAEIEFALLSDLRERGLKVPKPLLVDVSGDCFDRPYLMLEYVPGKIDFELENGVSNARKMARELAAFHAAGKPNRDLGLPHVCDLFKDALSEIPDTDEPAKKVRAALGPVWPLPDRNPMTLLHGDYWTGNVLWQDGEIAAVIDWEDASLGDPVADVAIARLEQAFNAGFEAMEAFTIEYRSRSDIDWADLAFWDLVATVRPLRYLSDWGLDDADEAEMRSVLSEFIDQTVGRISVS